MPLMRYRFLTSVQISVKLVIQPDTSPTLQYHGYGLVYHVACLFTSPALDEYSFCLPTEGSFRLSRPGCLVLRLEVVYPSKDGHTSRH